MPFVECFGRSISRLSQRLHSGETSRFAGPSVLLERSCETRRGTRRSVLLLPPSSVILSVAWKAEASQEVEIRLLASNSWLPLEADLGSSFVALVVAVEPC